MWRSRVQRVAFVLAAGFLLATLIEPGPPPPPPGPERAGLRFSPVALNEAEPGARRVGALLFLEGWAIAADNPRFGAISAIHVAAGQVIALNDAGTVIRFALPGRGPARVSLDPLPSGAGTPLRKRDRDSEAMLVEDGSMLVGFEGRNLVGRYRLPDLTPLAAARPAAMRRWRANAGAEAIVRLADGRYLLFEEGVDVDVWSHVVLFAGDPSSATTPTARLRYRRPPGFRITDAAMLPDGRVLLLLRRFELLAGIAASLAVIEPRDLRPGGEIESREIARLEAPLTVDNMEALSVEVEGGRTIVWLASDDNFLQLQRTLLLKFALVE